MRTHKLRTETEKALTEAGYQPGSWVWVDGPNRLVLAVCGQLMTVKLPGGMGKARFERVVGYLQGLAEGARILERAA